MRVAYLHGFAGHPAVWEATIGGVIGVASRAIALPGHGLGPVRETWHANLDAIADAIGDIDAVVGYSLGARVALGLVASARAPRAILISCNPGIADAERALRRASDGALARLVRARGIAAFVEAWETQPLFASQARVAPAQLAERRTRRLALDPEQLARSLEVMGLAEMPDYRAQITPDRVSLIAGAEDTKYVAIARGLPAPLEVIADCGHDPTLEQPSSLAAAISRALER
jgi:2-succinyl-6-hydroxy-2,4-cyclohexadiene-1-carboxylate synthase